MNQCDGCRQDAPLRDNLHIDNKGHAFMACQKEKYMPHPMSDLIDPEDGENRAVRCFLMLYGSGGLRVGQMKSHMQYSGWPHWPAWVDEPGNDMIHLTKGGAQHWLRHLFALEHKVEPVARLLHWHGPNPAPTATIAARTFAEFPKGAGEGDKGYWSEGAPLFTVPKP